MTRLLARPQTGRSEMAQTGGGERRSLTGATVIDLLTGGMPSASGVTVTPESSLRYTAVLACVRVLAEGVAALPCIMYERKGGGKERAQRHPAYMLLHDAPNSVQTALEFFEIGMAQVLLWGNFYAEIEWSERGQVRALWPLPAWRVTPMWDRAGKVYELELDDLSRVRFSDYQVLHVPGFGYDGTAGRSMISLAREAVGLGLAAQAFGAAFFGNGARPGVVLEHPAQLSDEAYGHLTESWNAQHQGLDNAHRVAILEEGMKLQTLGVPPEDAQFLETRQFQRNEIAAIFRVPPHMIGDLERATFSNIEQQSQEFYTNTLAPWLRRWEQRLARSLLVGRERGRYFPEFLVEALLRGDTATRYQAYATGRQWGWLSVNDIRARENMNPVENGDVYLQPLNMVEAGGEEPGMDGMDGEEGAARGVRARTVDGMDRMDRMDGMDTGTARAETRVRASVEVRAAGRRRLAQVHRDALADAAQRVVNRETNDIGNAARRFLPGRPAEFAAWLARFVEEHQAFVKDRLWASVWALARLAADQAAAEAQAAGHMEPVDEERVELFTRGVNAGRANGWTARLRHYVEQAAADDDDALAAMDEYLGQRRTDEASMWAREMSTAVVNAVALTVFGLAGVQLMRWSAAGGDTCPYCAALDGVVVAIGEAFVAHGGEVAPEGSEPMRPHHVTLHPPLHDGCECAVVIG